MFPGQGSQFPGMAMDLAEVSTSARALLERADDILGYSLAKIMAGERGEELNRTIHTQPAIFVHSMALFEVLKERCELLPIAAAGHSLGEYSALCAAGVLDFEEALDIIRVRATGMDEAQPARTCCMAALIGVSRDQALELVDRHRGDAVLEAANFNSPDQVVISGSVDSVSRVVQAFKGERRARAVMLPVSSAFHTSLMEPARQALRKRLENVAPKPPRFPVWANVNAQPYPTQESGTRQLLVDQVVNSVLWEDCVKNMIQAGAKIFLEVGPGRVLTGLMRRIDRNVEATSISDLRSIESFVEKCQ